MLQKVGAPPLIVYHLDLILLTGQPRIMVFTNPGPSFPYNQLVRSIMCFLVKLSYHHLSPPAFAGHKCPDKGGLPL